MMRLVPYAGFDPREKPRRDRLEDVSKTRAAQIERLWKAGHDTADIAELTGLTEAEVYNARARRTPPARPLSRTQTGERS